MARPKTTVTTRSIGRAQNLQALVLYSAPADLSMAPVGAPVGALLQISAAHTEKFQGVGQTVPRSFPHLLRDHGRSPDASHGRRRRYQRSAPSRNRTSRRFAEDARSVQADNHSARNAWADFRIGRRRGTAGRLAGLPRRDGAMVRPAPEDDDARALRRRFRLTRPLSRSDCRPQYRERID